MRLSSETVDDLAERVERAGDRYRNARDFKRANESDIAARAIRSSSDVSQAREIARAFEIGLSPGAIDQNGTLRLAGRSPRRPWWKWWRPSQTDDS
jgi:hypothetical protein